MQQPEFRRHFTADYRQVVPGRVSEDDTMAVVLTVKDWRAIAEHLMEDADAEGLGPAEMTVWLELDMISTGGATDEVIDKAHQHDARVTACHESAAGTIRCALVIKGTLARNGWTE